jgi:hypothetical protein
MNNMCAAPFPVYQPANWQVFLYNVRASTNGYAYVMESSNQTQDTVFRKKKTQDTVVYKCAMESEGYGAGK